MLENYLIVDEQVLPEVFSKVIQVKQLLNTGKHTQISEAVKEVGISRSAYYKYKDHVFSSESVSLVRKALISFVLTDVKGLLSTVLNVISDFGGSILTINQNIPIQQKANVVVSLDMQDLRIPIQELLDSIAKIPGVSKVSLLSIE